jgi:hypothetical protein
MNATTAIRGQFHDKGIQDLPVKTSNKPNRRLRIPVPIQSPNAISSDEITKSMARPISKNSVSVSHKNRATPYFLTFSLHPEKAAMLSRDLKFAQNVIQVLEIQAKYQTKTRSAVWS